MPQSTVLPPSSNLAASPLGMARRVQRAHALTAGVAVPTSSLARSSHHAAAMSTTTASSFPAVAMAALPSAPSMGHAVPRQSMGLFAHMPTAANAFSAAHLASEERWDARPLGPGEPAPTAAELARIYAFMDEAQLRTVALERQVEEQKETNRVLLISSSQELIALQERADALLFENAQMAAELSQLTAHNREMVAEAQAQALTQSQCAELQSRLRMLQQQQQQQQQGATPPFLVELPPALPVCSPDSSAVSVP